MRARAGTCGAERCLHIGREPVAGSSVGAARQGWRKVVVDRSTSDGLSRSFRSSGRLWFGYLIKDSRLFLSLVTLVVECLSSISEERLQNGILHEAA
jgi:hypothetical protein